MKKLISVSVVLFALLTGLSLLTTCRKEYSYEGGPKKGSAIYTLSGGGGICSGSTLSGDYIKGKALADTSTIQLEVHVDSIGTYSISTNTNDGFHFASNGTFTDTGTQYVILTATGTPGAVGDFTFSASATVPCTFTVTVTNAPVIQAVYTLTGTPDTCQNFAVHGNYIAGKAMDIANTVDVYVNVTAMGAYSLKTDTLDGISYSATGTFTATGIQKISLQASGTATDPRNLTFTPKINASHCTFNVAVINPEPLATYVLESGYGNPNPCIYSVSGNYSTQSPLGTTNTVTIKVFVTVLGNFTIATNTVNGMEFSHTGTFTTLGSQVVILTGSGTPVAAGTFSFAPQIVGPAPLGGQTCAFNVQVL